MKNIGEFFKRIGGVQAKELAGREAIRLAIKEFTHIDVSVASITIKSNTANIKGISQSARSVIFIHKKQIIDFASRLNSALYISDIR